ncbi:MAG: hypothetical protein VYE18_04385 [Pseudomonadota bacterium]|nr:hypothetical protein [Pseudomonadota bacterium]
MNLGLGAWVYRIAVAWITWELTKSTAWLGAMAAGTVIPLQAGGRRRQIGAGGHRQPHSRIPARRNPVTGGVARFLDPIAQRVGSASGAAAGLALMLPWARPLGSRRALSSGGRVQQP